MYDTLFSSGRADTHAEEVGDIIVHFDENGKPLFMEILKASKIVPLMVQGLAKKEVVIT